MWVLQVGLIMKLSQAALAVAALWLVAVVAVSARPRKYDTSFKGYRDDVLNIHLTCHTHDDVGWLKTVDEYFYGANNSIQHAGVQYILDSVMPALKANPDRQFLYIEQAFFQRWWREQDEDMQALTKQLHANGQLNFENGGWCMHDEANTHYIAMVDQTTVGHRLLLEEFGAIPRVGWQIDPFGHSATQAALLSAEMGFDSLFFGRIDYQDREKRLKEREMEMIWRASPSLGAAAQVFAGAFQSGNYGPPPGYCFDQFCSDPPMQTDPRLEDVNYKSEVDGIVKFALDAYSHAPQTNHFQFKMGSDFQYENANEWFKNLDKLIHYVNLDGRVNMFYSNPYAYTKAQSDANLTWTVKTDDFMPYADCPYCYWTGYFTSRPALKGYVRKAGAYLTATKQLDAMTSGNGTRWWQFAQDMGVVQHHDAVAGTEKQHVAYDYAKRICEGITAGEAIVNDALATLMTKSSSTPMQGSAFSQCQLLNQSICEPIASQRSFAGVVYNVEAQYLTQSLRIPVCCDNLEVLNATGDVIEYTVSDTPAGRTGSNPYTLTFQVRVPPTGFSTFFVQPKPASRVLRGGDVSDEAASHWATMQPSKFDPASTPDSIENEFYRIEFDASTGHMTTMTNLQSGVTTSLDQDWYWYNSSATGNGFHAADSSQNSGAYIFRPNASTPFAVQTGAVQNTFSISDTVQEVTQVWNSTWLKQTVRLYRGVRAAEVEFTVGPVPFHDGFGHEIITKYKTSIASDKTFYTDSNGREMQTRVRDYRETWTLNLTEPVAANYYPVNALITLNDSTAQFTVLTDRSEGGSSLTDGELELMVHRRILYDDGRGVGEPLNETTSCTPYPDFRRLGTGLVVTAKHFLQLEKPAAAPSVFRPMQQQVYAQPIIAFTPLTVTPQQFATTYNTQRSLIQAPLPANVGLMTLSSRGEKQLLLRLAHLYGINEDPVLSKPATVDLGKILNGVTIEKVEEMSLSANQPLSNIKKLTWHTTDGVMPKPPVIFPTGPPAPITLGPMQIRTFMLTLE